MGSRTARGFIILSLLCACARPSTATTSPLPAPPPAIVEAKPGQPGHSEAGLGPCATPKPAGTRALIDDFEDGNHQAFKAFGREGWWWSSGDATEGATLSPPPGRFAPQLLPEDERRRESTYAAHLVAEGQTDWGATWGTTLRWVGEGTKCPFNASRFAGLRVRVKGRGQVSLAVTTPGTVPQTDEFGGCETECWDIHRKDLELTSAWTTHTIRFDELAQEGWGSPVALDLTRLLGVQFSAKVEDLPVELWVDEIWFIETTEESTPAG